MLVSGSDAKPVLVYLASKCCLHYRMAQKKNLAELLRLEMVAIQAYFLLVGHGYLQHENIAGGALIFYITTLTLSVRAIT